MTILIIYGISISCVLYTTVCQWTHNNYNEWVVNPGKLYKNIIGVTWASMLFLVCSPILLLFTVTILRKEIRWRVASKKHVKKYTIYRWCVFFLADYVLINYEDKPYKISAEKACMLFRTERDEFYAFLYPCCKFYSKIPVELNREDLAKLVEPRFKLAFYKLFDKKFDTVRTLHCPTFVFFNLGNFIGNPSEEYFHNLSNSTPIWKTPYITSQEEDLRF